MLELLTAYGLPAGTLRLLIAVPTLMCAAMACGDRGF